MTLQVLGPVSIPELIGVGAGDEGGLSLTSAPVYVVRKALPEQTRYSALIDARLDRRGLMDLLFAVAPYKAHGPDRFSRVLDNWALFERAKASSASESLLQEHAKSLRFSWEEFARHRHVFVEVLQDQAGERCAIPLLAWSKAGDGKRRWELALDDEVLRTLEVVRPGLEHDLLDALVGLVTVPYFLPELCKTWRAWQPLTKNGKSNYIGPASVPVIALMHRRALLNSVLVQRIEEYATGQIGEDLPAK